MKKIAIFIMMLMALIIILPNNVVYAEEATAEDKLEEQVNTQLENFDFSSIEDVVNNDIVNLTEDKSFEDIVKELINGEYSTDFSTVFQKICEVLFGQIRKIIPIIFLIIAIAVLGNIVNSFQPSTNAKGISKICHFICIMVVIILIIEIIKNIFKSTTSCINSMTNQMSLIFPVLMTLLSAMGSVVTVGIYQPIVAVLTSGVTVVFKNIVYPIFILSLIFVILNNFSADIKLNKFISFLGSTFKYIVGFVFTLFAGLLTIQGVSAGKYDTISLKATRFAMKSYVPIIGGYLSDGLDYVMLSSLLIKNAIGVVGLIVMIGTILVPIINILVLKLGLQFVAGIIEPMGDSKISNLCEDISKILVYPIVIILAIAFMYFLSVGIMMCTVSGV